MDHWLNTETNIFSLNFYYPCLKNLHIVPLCLQKYRNMYPHHRFQKQVVSLDYMLYFELDDLNYWI